MKINNSFNLKGFGIKQEVNLSENQAKEKNLLDKLIEIMSNKYLWGVLFIVLALIFGLNVL